MDAIKQQSPIEIAMDTLRAALRQYPDYRETWVANIAVAFQDEFEKEGLAGEIVTREICHKLSNNAAERFIQNLVL